MPYIYSLAEVPEPEYFAARSSQGHEANAYLSYIVDHYHDLHRFTIFIHAKEDNWHNDVGGSKTWDQLPNLRFEAIERMGYVNLRCLDHPGCPNSLLPGGHDATDVKYQYLVENFPQMYSEIFGVDPIATPREIGHQCCGQFAATNQVIRQRPLIEYERMLNWVANTQSADSFGVGWVMEKLWHIIFGRESVQYVSIPVLNLHTNFHKRILKSPLLSSCKDVNQCRCDLYGWCGPNPAFFGILEPIK